MLINGLEITPERGVWEDMGLYWAWRAKKDGEPYRPPPTTKTLDYVKVRTHAHVVQFLCIGVWDDDKYTPMNRKELERICQRLD